MKEINDKIKKLLLSADGLYITSHLRLSNNSEKECVLRSKSIRVIGCKPMIILVESIACYRVILMKLLSRKLDNKLISEPDEIEDALLRLIGIEVEDLDKIEKDIVSLLEKFSGFKIDIFLNRRKYNTPVNLQAAVREMIEMLNYILDNLKYNIVKRTYECIDPI